MKYLQLFETRFKSPGIKEAYIGKYLREKFFPSTKEPHSISETYGKEIPNQIALYMINMNFFDLDGIYFDYLFELKNYLVDNYDFDLSDIGIYHRGNCTSEYDNRLEIVIRGIENIEKLEKEAKLYFDAKKYNI